ncbi:MAG TPA: ABC-type transport auxiliary lipoprotein family protein [Candidatus Binatus sp.]|nr:ABC-type transport auxiliary lipoprotein family protein [Candidatus Binatus sp.]
MFRSRTQLAAIIFSLICLSGCVASRPMKYYVIDPGAVPAPQGAPTYQVTLLVGRITASHLFRDDRIVYGSGPVQLGTFSYDRWAEPPADMLQDLLISSLRSTGQYRAVSGLSSNVRGDYVVRGHLWDISEVDRPELMARFSFEVELFDPNTRTTVWSHRYEHDEPAQGKTVNDVVIAMDKNVHAGLQQITAGISEYFATHPVQQPQAQSSE